MACRRHLSLCHELIFRNLLVESQLLRFPIKRRHSGFAIADPIPMIAGLAVLAVATVALTGWMIGSLRLTTVFMTQIRVMPNTALGLCAGAAALLLLRGSASTKSPTRILMSCLLSAVVLSIGLLTVLEIAFKIDLGIDNLIPTLAGNDSTSARMPAITAVELTLLGVGLLQWDTESRKGFPFVQLVMVGVATIALMPLLGYAYGGINDGDGKHIQIAIPTAVSLVVLPIGVLSLRTDRGGMKAFLSSRPGGVLARRMLPFVFIVPVCLGAVLLFAPNLGGLSAATVSSVTAVVTMLAFAAVTARAAAALNEVDERREDVAAQRADLARQQRTALIGQHARSMEDARSLRQEQLKAKDDVLSHVSHELRTPLTAAHQFVTILLDGLAGELQYQQREYLEIVARNLKQLQAMIGDLLDTTRLGGGKLAVQAYPVEVIGIMNDLFRILRRPAAEKGIALSLAPMDVPMVLADAPRVRQILTNLIENAIKFSDDGAIVVYASVEPSEPQFVRISVADTGPGIPQQSTERIFERLFQVDPELDSGRRGFGLGLYICRELAGRMGGRLWVETRVGYGSTFFLTLPVFAGRAPLQLKAV